MSRTEFHLGFGFSGIDRRITTRRGRKSFFATNLFRLKARGPVMRKISRSSRMRSRSGFMELLFSDLYQTFALLELNLQLLVCKFK